MRTAKMIPAVLAEGALHHLSREVSRPIACLINANVAYGVLRKYESHGSASPDQETVAPAPSATDKIDILKRLT